MTERNTVKMKRSEAIKPVRKPAADADIKAENSRLRADLAAARQRIDDLEQRVSEALNRIDWALDSLHSSVRDE